MQVTGRLENVPKGMEKCDCMRQRLIAFLNESTRNKNRKANQKRIRPNVVD